MSESFTKRVVPVRLTHLLIHTAILFVALVAILIFEVSGSYQSDRIEAGTRVIEQRILPCPVNNPERSSQDGDATAP